MPKFLMECKYCGWKWQDFVYTTEQAYEEKCPQCKDKAKKITKEEHGDIFGYEVK